MNNYIMYKDLDSENYIVEIFNKNSNDLYLIQKELVNKGFIIGTILSVLNTEHIYMLVSKIEVENE